MKRIVHSYTQRNPAAPEIVFPLLCPVREAEWAPGWKYRMVYSSSGVAELGCVFATPNPAGGETIWVVTGYDADSFAIAFAWVWPEMIATRLEIQLTPGEQGMTRSHIRYTYTALSKNGEVEMAKYDDSWFNEKMMEWESAINHFLRTGTPIPGAA